MSSDTDLVRAARGGDVVSLGLLLERHRASLHGVALRLLGNGPQAEDAVHDAFLVALRRIDQLREPAAVGGWLRAVVRNVCLMRLREGRMELPLDQVALDSQPRFLEPSAEEAVESLALRDWVWTALGELPEVLRATAILRYFGHHSSYDEIAAILGVPVGTVRSRLNQVKLKLGDAILKTAAVAHDEARQLTEEYSRFLSEVGSDYNRGEVNPEYLGVFAPDLEVVVSDGTVLRGRSLFAEVLRGDTEAGVKLHVTNVLASRGITVLEGAWENPPDDPDHCPPGMSHVSIWRAGKIQRIYLYYAPRPGEEDG